jgi:hypothetical protein
MKLMSMIDGVTFQSLDVIGKAVRGGRNIPFGGLQFVFMWRFYQLPPVSLRYGFSSEFWRRDDKRTASH